MARQEVAALLKNHHAFFASGKTRGLTHRVQQLKRLRSMIIGNESAIFDALARDLGKPAFEAYGGETGIMVREIDHALRNIAHWVRPEKARTLVAHQPASSFIMHEPYGVVLIISPWNFPIQLTLSPLVGALAAGNCALLKPSPLAPVTSRLIKKMVENEFDPGLVSCIEGGAETAQELLQEPFDYIFFTGGTATGRIVMAAAARSLTPVTLELGGKNPCIVDVDADLDVAARRIVWGKFFNAGQSCVAVDYLVAHRKIKNALIERIVHRVREFYGSDASTSPDFCRIVSPAHVDRLMGLLGCGTIVVGGQADRDARYVAPTVIDGITGSEPVMEDEIFGPILPVISCDNLSQAITFVRNRPKPLALYFFSRDRKLQNLVLRETVSGGVCINDTVIHETSELLPFGGAGPSGMGRYHGRESFRTFSYQRSVVRKGFRADVALRYPPYKDHLKWLKKLF
jgi:acyl-CoA reductase-like NAD-dependent aldehyde dehydrogenase